MFLARYGATLDLASSFHSAFHSSRMSLCALRLAAPVKLEITFKQTVNAEVASYLPGVERPNGDTIVFTGRDMNEVTRFLSAIALMNSF